MEWKRIFNLKMWIVIGAAIIINLILFVNGEMAGRNINDINIARQQYEWLVDYYNDIPLTEAYENCEKEYLALMRYIRGSSNTDEELKDLPNIQEIAPIILEHYQQLSDNEKIQFRSNYKEVRAKLKYMSGYSQSIDEIMENAAKLKRFSIFSNPKSFSYNNIIRTAKDFENVQGLELQLDNDKATDAYLNYYFQYYIVFAIMVIIIYSLFMEQENGMWSIIHNTPNGRMRLALKRFSIIGVASFALSFILNLTVLIASLLMHGGWSGMGNSIQTLNSFGKFVYRFSRIEYISVNFILSWFAMFTVCVVIWMLFVLFRNRKHTLVLLSGFIGIEILLYQSINIQSVYNTFRYINIVNLLKINEIHRSYLNWGFGTHVYSVLVLIFTALMLVMIIAAAVAVERATHMRPENKKTIIHKVVDIINKIYQKVFQNYPMVLKELHKLIITRKGVWVIVVMIIVSMYFSGTGKMNFSEEQTQKDKMYLEHGGKDYTYIEDYVQNKKNELADAMEYAEKIAQQYEAGEVDQEIYYKAVSNVTFLQMGMSYVEEFDEKITYLDKLKEEKDIDAYMISDRGYEEIFGSYSRQRELILVIMLVIGIMLIISESLYMENVTGMNAIVKSCARGRSWIFKRKLTACMIFTVGMTVVVYGIDVFNMIRFYGFPYLNAPVQSLMFMENTSLHVTILDWLLLMALVRLTVAIVTMIAALNVSKLIAKKGSKALMILALVVLIVVVVILHGMGGLI